MDIVLQIIILVLAIFAAIALLVLLLNWIFLPFLINGINKRLDEIIHPPQKK